MQNKSCPICNTDMMYFERYPKMICHECVKLALTEDGENIKFYNKDHSGGLYQL
jgi:uncharacterized Zn ribbon protein